MSLFTYKAIDPAGKATMGQLEALNLIDLEMRLKRMGLDLVTGGPTRRGGSLMRKGAIKREDLINFCFHLENLLKAGVPLVESLTDLRDSSENPRFREVISGVIESIQGGSALSVALADYPDVFSPVFAALIRAGENTGRMPAVLLSLTDTLKWEDELASQTKKIIMYPAFVGSTVLLVTFFLMIYLVPQMVGFIKSMGQTLPLQTVVLIAVSRFFVEYWWAMIAVPVGLFFGVKYAAANNPILRYQIDRAKLGVPLVGNILRKIILSRFASTFAMMYSAGITILDAMHNSEEIAGNLVIQEGLRMAGQEIAEGKSVTNSFQNVGLFPPLVIRMIRVGETTGALDNALLNVSYFYNREVRESIGKVQTMIEPMMTVILGAILGWVMLSVLGPIYDMMTKVKI
ncbi:MAG: secretion system protein [Betaproteobacteria bacterium RIFCSPLOWO2_02_FULL_62_17]|nr:MAG: secretion system protein [Betaproteobacteria bacterium RIFCSPLOWO2_02_FULL_62_17]